MYVLYRDKDPLIIGEENCVMLIINPRNDGEGAYEAELHIKIPPEADYTGVERNNKVNENQNVSDNHRIIKVGKDPQDHLVQPPPYHHYHSLDHVRKHQVQPLLKHLQRR